MTYFPCPSSPLYLYHRKEEDDRPSVKYPHQIEEDPEESEGSMQELEGDHDSPIYSTPKDPLTLLSLSEDDFEDEVIGEVPLSGEDLSNEDDDGVANDDEEEEDEVGREYFEKGDGDEEESDD